MSAPLRAAIPAADRAVDAAADADAAVAARGRARRAIAMALAGVVVSLQLTGCVSAPPPRELDLRSMRIVAATTPPRLDVSGLPGGKAAGIGVGAGTGTGAGALLGAAACVAAGPLIGLCLAAVLPATTVAGAVTGGVVGGVKTETAEALARKTRALQDELVAHGYPQMLAERLRDELAGTGSVAAPRPAAWTPGADADVTAAPTPWQLDVAVTEIGTEGKREFALRIVTRIALRRGAAAEPVWTVDKEVQSETELSTSAWLLADAGAMRAVLDRCIRQAAHELAVDLTRPAAGPAAATHPRSRRSGSCHDVPNDVIKATAS